jgi:hypothetical protein
MNSLTEYRRPVIRFGREQAAHSPWLSPHGWFQAADGSWRRIWTRRGGRALSARRAVVERIGGWWVWRVEVFEIRTKAARRIAAQSLHGTGHPCPAACFPFAELAAKTAD